MSKFRTIEISDPRFTHEGLRYVTVKTPNLRGRGDITLYVPEEKGNALLPIVILMHGVYGSHWAWSLKGGAHRTAQRLISEGAIPPMVIAMPSDGLWGDGSGYLPHADKNFDAWIMENVPAAVHEAVPETSQKSPLFICGLSMGGYGALRLGGKYAERFRGISGHSSITHFDQMKHFAEEPLESYHIPENEKSAFEFLKANREKLPPLRFDCGTEDHLLEYNRLLHSQLNASGIPHEYQEFPGCHEWPYWERHFEDSLRFFGQELHNKKSR